MATNWEKHTIEFEKMLRDFETGVIPDRVTYSEFAKKKRLHPGTSRNQITRVMRERREAGVPLGEKRPPQKKKKVTSKSENSPKKSSGNKAGRVTKKGSKKKPEKKVTKGHNENPKKSKGKAASNATGGYTSSPPIPAQNINWDEEFESLELDPLFVPWLTSGHRTISSWAVSLGVNPKNGSFRRRTKGWTQKKREYEADERKIAFQQFESIDIERIDKETCVFLNSMLERSWQNLRHMDRLTIYDPKEAEQYVKTAQASIDLHLKVKTMLVEHMRETERIELLEQLGNEDIDIVEFVVQCVKKRIPISGIHVEAFKAKLKEGDDTPDWGDFDPEKEEEADTIAEKETSEVIRFIRDGAPEFKKKREKEVADLKKELYPKTKPKAVNDD